jgi:STE24 endopeptidase
VIAVVAVLLVLGSLAVGVVLLGQVPAQPAPAVTEADLARDFTPDERAREQAFRRRVRPWGVGGALLDALVPTALVLSGALVPLAPADRSWWLGVLATTTVVLLAGRAATLPGAVAVRRASLEIGLAAGGWLRWCRDLAVAWLLGWVITSAALLGWVAAARLWPQTWWLPVAAVAAAAVVLLSFVLPVVVEPLFARFTPLPAGPLRDRVLALAGAAGVQVRDVLVADASRRTTALNAYVSGLGRTRRVVVHDTLLGTGRDDEVAAVVAHELGHVVARDVTVGTAVGAAGAALGVLAGYLLLAWPPLLGAAHVTGPADPAVAGLLLALGAWAGLLGAPLQTAVSRRIERRADAFSLDLVRDPATVARMQRSLAVTNVAALRPPRLLQLWFGTHPTSPERIASARAWGAAHGVDVPPLVDPEP